MIIFIVALGLKKTKQWLWQHHCNTIALKIYCISLNTPVTTSSCNVKFDVIRPRAQPEKIKRGPNFATFSVTSFTYNDILPFANYVRRYYINC